MKRIIGFGAVAGLGFMAASALAAPQIAGPPGADPAKGEQIFNARCKSCHDPAVDRAPPKTQLAAFNGEVIINALKTGLMQPMAQGLSQNDIESVAVYLTGRSEIRSAYNNAEEGKNACPKGAKFNPAGPSWNGWSPDPQNSHMAAQTTINAVNVDRLKVKWAFAYQGGRYGQPSQVGNRIFTASSSGVAYALDRNTGCVAWSFSIPNGIRVTPSVGRMAKAPSGYAVYLGDYAHNVYALDANSGKVLWKTNIEPHPRAVLTGAPVLYQGMLYVPVSSWEETISGVANYECCTFRGSVAAVDANTGKIAWHTYVMPPAKPFKKNSAGTQMYGPAGGAIWSAPTIDPKRGQLYVTTGDSYTDLDANAADSVVAMDLKSGAIKWSHQMTAKDNFLVGCSPGRMGLNCPTPVGPDVDFGASAILRHLKDGRDLVLAGQKSGQVYAVNPDNGEIVWQTRIGQGSAGGGVEWGMSADNDNLYVGTADRGMPALTALRLSDGALLWQHRAPDAKCSFKTPRCSNGYAAPSSVANGVVLAPNQDGHIRAYETKTGKLVWDYDTAGRTYDTVNGVKGQHGGNLDGSGISLAGNMAVTMAGYSGASSAGGPDNVLLAFTVDGK